MTSAVELITASVPLDEMESAQPLRSLAIEEFLSLDIPPREMVLGPVIPAQGLVMLYSKREAWGRLMST